MGWFNKFSKYNKTNFKAGGCLIADIPMGADLVKADHKFVAPRRIDYRDMLVASSDQGQTSECVGYSCAGLAEFWHWRREHYPKQFSGSAIYAEAKKLDGSPNVKGTWPKFGVQAAINLGFLKGKAKYIPSSINDIKFTLHEFGPFVGGFMIDTNWNYVDKKTGLIRNIPGATKLGGHCVVIAGYSDYGTSAGIFLQNSWSASYGIHGFCILGWEQVEKQFMNGMIIIPE